MKKILVVEDDEVMRDLVCKFLERAGYETIKASDGLIAINIIENAEIDLLLTDIFMPNIEGMELIRRVKDADYSFPIVVMSGDRKLSDHYLKMSEKLGADRIVSKPIDYDTLIKTIGDLID